MSGSEDQAESIRQRIRNAVRARGEDVQFGLQRYAVERFLYRLGKSTHRDRFVLKGAMLYALWGGSAYRPTRDLDFTGYGSSAIEDLLKVFRELCAMPDMDDGLVFDGTTLSAEPIRGEAEYNGMRIRFDARLGDSRIQMQIDIGFGNAIEPAALDVEYPTLLEHPRPRIRAYPQEAVVAEKLHAMVVLGERNSRYKDFYDLHALALQFPFDGGQLTRAISATFDRRSTGFDATLPAALSPRFYADAARAAQWRGYRTRSSLPGAPADFDAVGILLQAFLVPPWRALATASPFADSWASGGPWRPGTAIPRAEP